AFEVSWKSSKEATRIKAHTIRRLETADQLKRDVRRLHTFNSFEVWEGRWVITIISEMPIGITCEGMTRFTRYPHLGAVEDGTFKWTTRRRKMQRPGQFLFLPEL